MNRVILSLIAIVFATTGAAASAADQLILDPSKTDCKLENYEEQNESYKGYGFKSCNVYYDGVIVHNGRGTDSAHAGGDCVKCKSVVATAKAQNASVVMDRSWRGNVEADWYHEGFFKVDAESKCSY